MQSKHPMSFAIFFVFINNIGKSKDFQIFTSQTHYHGFLQYNFRDWIFGSYFCRVTNFMTHMSIIASVLTMAAIAMERYSLQ